MRRLFLAVVGVALAALSALAAATAAEVPAPAATSPAPTATSPVPSAVARMLADEKPPGVQILVVDHGRVIDDRNVGVADLATKRPVSAHTRFEIGSVTKQFTAAAIVQLAERGKLALSDPLGRWVPEYRPGRRVTLQQLLWQVSGIPDYTSAEAYPKLIRMRGNRAEFSENLDLHGVLALIAGKPLEFRPGSAWAYSNTNYALLAAVVTKASGTPWKQYLRANLLARAGMTDTGFVREAVPGGELATGYGLARRTLAPIAVGPPPGEGDGGIVSTAHDLARWNAALFGGRIVSPRNVARMTAPGPHPQGATGYGYGLQIDTYDGVKRISHGGVSLGFTATDAIYPSLEQQVIVLTNATYAGSGDIADAAFDDVHPQLAASSNAGAAGEKPAITALLKRLWSGMVRGHVDPSILDAHMGRYMAGRGARLNRFAVYGGDARWVYRGSMVGPLRAMSPIYTYRLLFASGRRVDLSVALSPRGKIASVMYRAR